MKKRRAASSQTFFDDAADLLRWVMDARLDLIEAVASDPQTFAPGAPGLDEALERGRQMRDVYYRSRITLSELPLTVIGQVHALLEERREVHRDSILDEIDHCLDEGLGDAAGKRVRSRFADAEGVFNALLHVGLIAQDGSLMCTSPIPSMSAHVIEGCKSQGIELARPGRPADLLPATPRQRGIRP